MRTLRTRLTLSRASSFPNAGFSLVELVVVAGIITLISTALILKQSSFDSTVLLRSLAYEVALSIRQAQVYGLSVREQGVGSANFDVGYGVHFSGANPTTYILFADEDRDSRYDEGESVEVFTLRRGYRITAACATLVQSGAERCTPGELSSLSIAFRRPDPDALIRSDLVSESYGTATITLLAPDGESARVISVASTGQIEVKQTQ